MSDNYTNARDQAVFYALRLQEINNVFWNADDLVKAAEVIEKFLSGRVTI